MRNEDIKITKEELKKIFRRVDKSNNMNFETLEELLKDEYLDNSLVFEIIDNLETGYGFSCEADLDDITEDEIEALVDTINNI
ncbi:hypothetical protein [Oceanirhabdus sp. W0125-5]|uniref:hypothetical protein n=1 Tax=Oceanirhabdus sp. W0125-5 TaxID=2999116 RepID=UPI0022F2F076|nr:hypothetical protein [Oceanirhabdus sp. W0125-5]WBW94962.1 hypothetical protein OW730_14800 [Oceanirhabdus sp. W0125-5]